MTILVWLTLGLTIGVVASRLPSFGERPVPAELALGLVASVIGGVLALVFG